MFIKELIRFLYTVKSSVTPEAYRRPNSFAIQIITVNSLHLNKIIVFIRERTIKFLRKTNKLLQF